MQFYHLIIKLYILYEEERVRIKTENNYEMSEKPNILKRKEAYSEFKKPLILNKKIKEEVLDAVSKFVDLY